MEGSQYIFRKKQRNSITEIRQPWKEIDKNPDKAKQYLNTIKRYLELGHATKIRATESTTY